VIYGNILKLKRMIWDRTGRCSDSSVVLLVYSGDTPFQVWTVTPPILTEVLMVT